MKGKENGNSPAFAIELTDEAKGLTKREYIATMIAQGMCAGRTEYEQPGVDVQQAVRLADLLLEELTQQ